MSNGDYTKPKERRVMKQESRDKKGKKINIVVERKNEWRELIVLQFAMILIFLNIEISQQSIQQ